MSQTKEITIKALEKKIVSLKNEIRMMQIAAERRNEELKALHYVWCSGGCHGGVHFYDDKGPEEITEELV